MSGFRWTAEEVARALGAGAGGVDGGRAGAGDSGEPRAAPGLVFSGVSTDTRKIGPGSLFVALKGANFDAHDFLSQAADAGATGAVVSHRPADAPAHLVYFTVDDTLHALGRLGNHRRRALSAKVVAVAGSNGKTTTKDLLRAALSPRFRVHATEGNLNNQVGVPLTLLAAPDDAEVLVVETGTNEPGEIEILGAIVEPDAAVITSIGEEHLEGLGSVEGVLEEELSILRHLRPSGVAVVAEDPTELPERAERIVGGMRLRVAGFDAEADVRPDGGAEGIEVLPGGATRWTFRGTPIDLPLPGMHNVRNALVALGVSAELGVPVEESARSIAAMPAPKMRNEWRRVGSLNVLADCYNANPPSTRAALDLLASLPSSGEKIAVIGTMRELGGHAEGLHRSVGEAALARLGSGIDLLVATGDFVPAIGDADGEARVIAAEDPLEAYEALRPRLKGDETILLKGSRGVALERLIPLLERDFAGGAAAASTAHAGH
ncbi:UDP-N-acetylmuramoyl-tripeptide--D-alanyl-D-alanine ligase [Longimicrobium sp.]|uniref:UDP-N-acetylmuramoyl-tripeptide--D-alanyl-D- alanine ligase n=1 Tax=Longimicrobium sp. TaxID=2029185 RepID=UPI002CE723A5|nr:UDP-N-acetylmuramoyl-tripeptide--D-alanyl-D-alanine ligase [Longimicrobium sp.]HSU15190.1 UDP-N-acetylmuramoyl-tripeptide--D-alanyl-D-alanine ligase [Longimicrobium sp.]